MPDGANNTDNTEQQDPGTPSDQVDTEIAVAQVTDWWRSLFGIGDPHEAGGGGTGGQFMFTNPEELAMVIGKWEDEREAIGADRTEIAAAYWAIADPAGDPMTKGQTSASRDSLASMYYHSDAMWQYADSYIAKLKASHTQMQLSDEGARDTMRGVQAEA